MRTRCYSRKQPEEFGGELKLALSVEQEIIHDFRLKNEHETTRERFVVPSDHMIGGGKPKQGSLPPDRIIRVPAHNTGDVTRLTGAGKL
jgi:hypothetical protein